MVRKTGAETGASESIYGASFRSVCHGCYRLNAVHVTQQTTDGLVV